MIESVPGDYWRMVGHGYDMRDMNGRNSKQDA